MVGGESILESTYPDAADVFGISIPDIREVVGVCDIVLDTNVLLVPYTTGGESLKAISNVLHRLASEGRLYVPGRVAREFAGHRASKLKDLYQRLLDENSRLQIPRTIYPLLNGLDEYVAVQKIEEELRILSENYKAARARLVNLIRDWRWNDPVSEIYRKIFTDKVVCDPPFDTDAVSKELKYRYENKIPPGYKDAAKPDDGVGDLLIWKTVLHIAENRHNHLIFVTGEEKSDWWHRSGNKGLYPRFELQYEYRKTSDRKSFHILPLSELLQFFDAGTDAVNEVHRQEEANREKNARRRGVPHLDEKGVLAAMERFDRIREGDEWWRGFPSDRHYGHRYAIWHDGKLYPVKTIISMASNMPTSEFSGGATANKRIQELGFLVEPIRTLRPDDRIIDEDDGVDGE